ncbi:MAG: amidohydrolase family protein [Anaerolineae bacterium]|nr:amidohydrolase family protein [Anaerolineae bacterium]
MFRRSLTFINVTVLTAAGPIGNALRVSGSRISAIDTPPQKRDVVIDGQGSLLIPGLINAHDHLELNTFQRLKYREQYSHSLQWIEDIEARFNTNPELIEPRRQPLADRLLIGAVKNLLSGVTTVCHHNPLHRPLRYNYPIRVVKNYGFCHSLFRGDDPAISYHQTKANYPWIIHLAEGSDDAARQEFEQLDRAGLVQPNTILVHGVGLTPLQRRELIERGGGLVWCPGSNLFMLGQTAQVGELAAAGKLALGSDSRLSGESDLLAELRVAAATHQLSAEALFRTVTLDAARLLRLRPAGLGNLEVGGVADLVLLPSSGEEDLFSAIHQQTRSHLNLVMLAGKPLVGDESMQSAFDATHVAAQKVQVDGISKLMRRNLVNRPRRINVAEPGLTW